MDKQPGSTRAVDQAVVERVFMALHGFYGALFFDKFKLGVNENGRDVGIENAKRVWLASLAELSVGEVFGGLRIIRNSGSAFAPSLPEFLAACRACRKAAPAPRLPAPTTQFTREKIAEARRALAARSSTGGLATLFSCIATSVRHAGGDEVETLRRLDEIVARRSAQ